MSSANASDVTARVVAGIGGLLLGHALWLIAISMASGSSAVNAWVLVVAALVAAGATLAWRRARRSYRRKDMVPAAFFAALPILPVIFTVIVLGDTYL